MDKIILIIAFYASLAIVAFLDIRNSKEMKGIKKELEDLKKELKDNASKE